MTAFMHDPDYRVDVAELSKAERVDRAWRINEAVRILREMRKISRTGTLHAQIARTEAQLQRLRERRAKAVNAARSAREPL